MDTFITPEIKDLVLTTLTSSGHIGGEFNIKTMAKNIGITPNSLDAILRHFVKHELLSCSRTLGGDVLFTLNAEAFDLVNRGGFTATEKLLKQNIEKLLLEIEALRPSFPQRAETITSIIAGISSALSLFK